MKKTTIILIVFIGLVSMFFVFNKNNAYKELPKVKLKDDINKSGLAIMVESDYQTGEYQKLDSTTFPTDGFTLNRIKSGCVDKNGKDVDALTYNESDKTISIKTKQSVYCYLYYDNLFKGSGTEDSPYQINYIEDLVRLSNSVNKDLNTYADKNFILMRDLDFNENDSYMKYNDTGFGDINGVNSIEGIKEELTNKEGSGFTSIGNLTIHFQGNFNGNNKRLDNLYILNKTDNNYLVGLFGSVENSEIKDLTISGNLNTKVATRVGGLVGFSYGTTTIENCVNEVIGNNDVGANSVGGFVGDVIGNLSITNSINKGQISGGNNAGGLAGFVGTNATLTIENSHNEGTITNEVGSQAGGLLGRDAGATSKTIIKNSYNIGEVTDSKTYEGGFAGLIFGTIEIDDSYNTGKISNTLGTYVGGLIGYGDTTSNITINNSYNNHDIIISPNSENRFCLGGLIAMVLGKININNSYNTGNIINEKTKYLTRYVLIIGGLIGNLDSYDNSISYINNSYNIGNITNGDLMGGLVAYNHNNHTLIIDRSYNTGNITSNLDYTEISNDTGTVLSGIIGINQSYSTGIILNSYNTGTLDISNLKQINEVKRVAGITTDNRGGNSIIINSYNLGDIENQGISAGIYVGELIGDFGGYLKEYNIYNVGNITGTTKRGLNYVTHDYTINNAYYLNNIAGSNVGETTPMEETDMKSKTFVDTLNKNVDELNNTGLETIDENLKGYELEKWGLAANNTKIPVLTRKIEDLSGHGNHGLSYAVKYDSEGVTTSTDSTHRGYINAGLSDYDFGNSFSLVIKVKMNQILYDNAIMGSWETGGIGLAFFQDNTFGNSVYTDKYYAVNGSYDFNTTDWYTLLVTYDGSLPSDNLKMYVNGELAGSTNVTGNIKKPDGRGPIIIGGNPQYRYNENYEVISNVYATYKEALIFDRALTEEQDHISTNYKDNIKVENQDELLVWYKF